MTDIDVAALRAVAESASAWNAGFGWTYAPGQIYVTAPSVVSSDPELDDPDCRDLYTVVQGTWEQDARHIAAFDPPTVLALLDRLAVAEAAVERVRNLRALIQLSKEDAEKHGTTFEIRVTHLIAMLAHAAKETP